MIMLLYKLTKMHLGVDTVGLRQGGMGGDRRAWRP